MTRSDFRTTTNHIEASEKQRTKARPMDSSQKGHELALAATALLMGLAVTLVFLWAPEAQGLGLDFKIFFFHVPAAWIMLLSAILAGLASARSLLWDQPDHLAAAATDLTVLYGVIVLITGPLWAWRAWGKPWIWEPRLTTSLVCWLTYAVALVVRGAGPQGRRTALLLALLGAFEVPLVYLSVRWWAGGHHPPTSLVPSLSGRYAATLLISLVAATCLWGLLLGQALRQRRLQSRLIKVEALARTLGATVLGLTLLVGLPTRTWAGPTGQTVRQASSKRRHSPAARTDHNPPKKPQTTVSGSGFVPYRAPRPSPDSQPSRATLAALLAAYLAFWGVLFLYLVILARKNRDLEKRLEAMERRFGPRASTHPVQGDEAPPTEGEGSKP